MQGVKASIEVFRAAQATFNLPYQYCDDAPGGAVGIRGKRCERL